MEETGYFGKRIWSAMILHNILLPFFVLKIKIISRKPVK